MKENRIEDRINNAYCFLNSMHSDFRTGLYYKEDLENLEHILSDYKRVLKENEKLKDKLLDTLKGQKVIEEETTQYIKENYIPKQKVKDKIEELYQQDRNWSEEMSEPDSNFKNIDRNLKRIKNQIDVLQELIEESEENKNE